MSDNLVQRLASAPTLEAMPSVVDVAKAAPPNPPEFIQKKFVGASYRDAYEEAQTFVSRSFELHEQHAAPERRGVGRVVDFGSGWGRISRFLIDRVSPTSVFAIDVDPAMTALVNSTLPGVNAMTTTPLPPSMIADRAVDLTLAFSVFSHLAPVAHGAWADEFGRITRPGGGIAITVLECDFLGQVEAAQKAVAAGTADAFETSLGALLPDIDAAVRAFEQGEVVYAPTSDGVRTGDFYGWAAAPRPYVERIWGDAGFGIVEWIPSGTLFPQALVFLVRRADSRSESAAKFSARIVGGSLRSVGRKVRHSRARLRRAK